MFLSVADYSPTHSTHGTYSTQTASFELRSDGVVVTKEMRARWAYVDRLLSNITPEQRAVVREVPAARNSEDLELFAK